MESWPHPSERHEAGRGRAERPADLAHGPSPLREDRGERHGGGAHEADLVRGLELVLDLERIGRAA
ncbi:MAG: hypothetical protein U0353_17540 [Sandaracinus sp.]